METDCDTFSIKIAAQDFGAHVESMDDLTEDPDFCATVKKIIIQRESRRKNASSDDRNDEDTDSDL